MGLPGGWPPRCGWFLAFLVALGLANPSPVPAQVAFPKRTPPVIQRQQGLHYYLIENLSQNIVAQRGTAGGLGFAFDRLVLPPNTRLRLWILQANTLDAGFAEFTTPPIGRSFQFPEIPLGRPVSTDDDEDGLHADGEYIVGTDPANPDTDGDGVLDGAEVQQGLDPLSGRAARLGIIGTADTPGIAQDICAVNDLAIVADGPAGISVFNIFNAMNPVIVAQVDTPGTARAVACDGNLVAVADGPAGLAVIDVADPPAARIVRQMTLGSDARAVAVAAHLAFVGLASGQVVVLDIQTGLVLDRIALDSNAVQDVLVLGDGVYALTVGRLHVLSFQEGVVARVATVDAPGGLGAGGRRLRLFGGGDRLYATHTSGFNVFDLAIPRAPVLLRQHVTGQFGWKQIVANGSGLGFAAVSPNSTDDGPHHVSLFQIDPSGTNRVFLAEFPTPGLAAAVAIYNGQGYVADSANGLQVINYLAFDNRKQAPAIRLESNFGLDRAEEGKLMRVSAFVSDDVQVRNVEFHVDGRKVVTDGNYPFVASFVTPRAGTIASFTLRARASDTGGNATWTDEYRVTLVPDATAPFVTRVSPASGALLGKLSSVNVFFSEPIDLATLTPASLAVVGAGPDGAPGTADDQPVPGATYAYRDELQAVTLGFQAPLSPGSYRVVAAAPLADLAGNPLRREFNSRFRVFAGDDLDQDGVPDELEPSLGLRAGNPDSDGDGILDGNEDFDRDALSNAGEILLGTDPVVADTDGDGLRDGDEDSDGDFLTDGVEVGLGTSPFSRDTDLDGWTDDAELTARSNPVDAQSRPNLLVAAAPPVSMVLPVARSEIPGLSFGPWLARPPLGVALPGPEDGLRFAIGTTLATPPVFVAIPSVAGDPLARFGPYLAQPPVGVILTRADDGATFSLGTVLAVPPVSLLLPGSSSEPGVAKGTVLGSPPVFLKINP